MPNPLYKKLGLKPGMKACVLQPPEDYFDLIEGVSDDVHFIELADEMDFIHYFSMAGAQLALDFPLLKQRINKKGMIWISWPKGTSKVNTDLNSNMVRKIGLDAGLVDVKVCSVDEIWSGLKFMWRTKDR